MVSQALSLATTETGMTPMAFFTSRHLAVSVVALSLAACSSSNSKEDNVPVGTTPTGTPTPVATVSPTPTSAAVTPTPTMAPGGNPTPAPSAGPSATPIPTGSPNPSVTPAPSASPDPSATPAPTPTPGLAGRVDSGVPAGSTVVVEPGSTCLVCTVSNETAVLDPDWENFATASLQVGALAAIGGLGELVVTVNLPQSIDPTVAVPAANGGTTLPDNAGFVVSFPDSTLASLSVLPTIEIAVLLDGEVVGDVTSYGYGFFESLALGTVLQDINNARVYLGNEASGPYNAIRLTFTASIADLLLNINLHQVAIAGVAGSIAGDF